MEEKNDVDKMEDAMLPGFRFHPTDEELVGFYLKRKVQQKPLPIELIKQVDIYKYEPWDLPRPAASGEKEWYFYCPRDRKYRNSARPNRVTGAGFWKATGTDRPIYSSDGTKCIGLKKSLVFYRGRAAKGVKTDWMMHEFRLPSVSDSTTAKKILDKSYPANDAWAICRIFKKTNSMAQRALSHSWMSSISETVASDTLNQGIHGTQFSPENISCTTETNSSAAMQLCSNENIQRASTTYYSSTMNIPPYKSYNNPIIYKPSLFPLSNGDLPNNLIFSSDTPSMLLNPAFISEISKTSGIIDFQGQEQQQFTSFSINLPQEMQGEDTRRNQENIQWGNVRTSSIGFPFNLPPNLADSWKQGLPWDSPSCPSEMSTTYSPGKCYNE